MQDNTHQDGSVIREVFHTDARKAKAVAAIDNPNQNRLEIPKQTPGANWLQLLEHIGELREHGELLSEIEKEFVEAVWVYVKDKMVLSQHVGDAIMILHDRFTERDSRDDS